MFDLTFHMLEKRTVKFKKCDFVDCESTNDVRTWLNTVERFINIKDTIINLDNVLTIDVTKREE